MRQRGDKKEGVVCASCGHGVSRVMDSRAAMLGELQTTRRRRCCKDCGFRFTTYEVPAEVVQRIDHMVEKSSFATLQAATVVLREAAKALDEVVWRQDG